MSHMSRIQDMDKISKKREENRRALLRTEEMKMLEWEKEIARKEDKRNAQIAVYEAWLQKREQMWDKEFSANPKVHREKNDVWT